MGLGYEHCVSLHGGDGYQLRFMPHCTLMSAIDARRRANTEDVNLARSQRRLEH